jgi:hypothetical protein
MRVDRVANERNSGLFLKSTGSVIIEIVARFKPSLSLACVGMHEILLHHQWFSNSD